MKLKLYETNAKTCVRSITVVLVRAVYRKNYFHKNVSGSEERFHIRNICLHELKFFSFFKFMNCNSNHFISNYLKDFLNENDHYCKLNEMIFLNFQ